MRSEEEIRSMARTLAETIQDAGGSVYYVGGQVRDELLGLENKDYDMEVHGISPERLEEILNGLGTCLTIGKSFGIFGLSGYPFDIAMPRKEKATGTGHRDFFVTVDPYLSPEKAALRRDFTVNAMMKDVLTGELLDPYGGSEDLKQKILRPVSPDAFREDPLRVLRAAQFAARYGLIPEEQTLSLGHDAVVSALSRERVEEELKKALLKSDTPSVFFRVLKQMDQLHDWFPEMENGQPEDASLPDGMALRREQTEYPYAAMLSALLCRKNEKETDSFLKRIVGKKETAARVRTLCRLFRLGTALPETGEERDNELCYLLSQTDCPAILTGLWILTKQDPEKERYQTVLALFRERQKQPGVTGTDLLAMGRKPGKDLGEALAYASRRHWEGAARETILAELDTKEKTETEIT